MKRATSFVLALLMIPVLCAGITGCCSTQLKTQAKGFDSATKEIFAEYEAIVIDGKPRPNFSDSDKEIRRGSLRKFKELVDQQK